MMKIECRLMDASRLGQAVAEQRAGTAGAWQARETATGAVEDCREPGVAGLLPRRPLFADRRGDRSWIFSCEQGELRIEGYVDTSTDTYHTQAQTLAQGLAGVEQAAQGGEFTVLLLSDNTLFYLLWHADTQSWSAPGRLPPMPRLEVRATPAVEMSGVVEPVVFGSRQGDMRSGVPRKIGVAVQAAAVQAWSDLEENARQAGRWVQPVAVRMVARLWDGTALWVSEPQIVETAGWQGAARVMLPLEGDVAAWTATGQATLSAPTYQLSARYDWQGSGSWDDVVRYVELWASEDIDTLSRPGVPRVSYSYTAQQGGRLGVVLGRRERVELTDELLAAGMRRIGYLSPGEQTFARSARGETMRLTSPDDDPSLLRARCIAGHAAFFHAAGAGYQSAEPIFRPVRGLDEVRWHVEVELEGSPARKVSASGSGTGADGVVAPLLWYPSRRAVSMTIWMRGPSGTTKGVFPLRPSPTGENAACYVDAELLCPALDPTDEPWPEPDGSQSPVYSRRGVVTSVRGNPFVRASYTVDVGGEPRRMAAQPSGGGAYTRQYLYCCCEDGLMALTYDSAGRHTNCRMISPSYVESLAVADTAVWGLTEQGTLLRVHDAKVETQVRCLDGYAHLVWDGRTGELTLAGRHTAQSAVRSERNRWAWRDMSYAEAFLPGAHRPLAYAPLGLSWRLLMPGKDDTLAAGAAWQSDPMTPDIDGLVFVETEWERVPRSSEVTLFVHTPGQTPYPLAIAPVESLETWRVRFATLLPSARAMRKLGWRLSVRVQWTDGALCSVAILHA